MKVITVLYRGNVRSSEWSNDILYSALPVSSLNDLLAFTTDQSHKLEIVQYHDQSQLRRADQSHNIISAFVANKGNSSKEQKNFEEIILSIREALPLTPIYARWSPGLPKPRRRLRGGGTLQPAPAPYEPSSSLVSQPFRLFTGRSVDIAQTIIRDWIKSGLIDSGNNPKPEIQKTIEFAPHHKRAGIDLLNYFSDYLQNRHPDIDATVRIEQHGDKVTLEVKTDDHSVEKVEATLTEYGEVLIGKQKLEVVLTNQLHIVTLRNELRNAASKVEMYSEMLAIERGEKADLMKMLANRISVPSPPINITAPVTVNVDSTAEATAKSKSTSSATTHQITQAIKDLQADVEKADEESIPQTTKKKILSTLGDALEGVAKDRVKEALATIKDIATDLAPLAGRASMEVVRGLWG